MQLCGIAGAGVVALLLQVRPQLGWRDVQEIMGLSALMSSAVTCNHKSQHVALFQNGAKNLDFEMYFSPFGRKTANHNIGPLFLTAPKTGFEMCASPSTVGCWMPGKKCVSKPVLKGFSTFNL